MTVEPGCTIAYLTAGAGGMYCGSCMHDNTLASALSRLGVDIQLIPTYTPIRTDEEDVSLDHVFFSGINIFLQQRLPLYRLVPSIIRGVFDRPRLIRWATSRPSSIRAKSLGALTVSMLRGDAGNQRTEVEKLCTWLGRLQPRLILFTNLLIAGCAERLRTELGTPLVVTLQGDDAFLEHLVEPYRTQAMKEIRRLVTHIDGFLVHSRYYAAFMQEYLNVPAEKFCLVPLGVDTRDFPVPPGESPESRRAAEPRRPTRCVGYLARLAPEKGLHLLVDAFLELRKRDSTKDVRLRVAGWLGEDQRSYAENEFARLRAAGLEDAFEYVGAVDRRGKLEFLQGIDVLSVPTTYRDPKGLFVLEALAAGVPVVQPDHGAFPELLQSTGGGRLVPPHDPLQLADALADLLSDDDARRSLGRQGARTVLSKFNAEAMAAATWDALQPFLD